MTRRDDRKTWRRLGAGVYDDGAGAVHLVLTEMLEGNGWPDTPANRVALERAAKEVFGAQGILVTEAEDEAN